METQLPLNERGTVLLCGFCHISTPGFRVALVGCLYHVFCNVLRQIPHLSTITVTLDVKRRSLTLFPVLLKPEIVFSFQMVADIFELEVGYCGLVYVVSAIFPLPVWA